MATLNSFRNTVPKKKNLGFLEVFLFCLNKELIVTLGAISEKH